MPVLFFHAQYASGATTAAAACTKPHSAPHRLHLPKVTYSLLPLSPPVCTLSSHSFLLCRRRARSTMPPLSAPPLRPLYTATVKCTAAATALPYLFPMQQPPKCSNYIKEELRTLFCLYSSRLTLL